MKERPIIMRAHEVNAILEGRKTQFRRMVKPQPAWVDGRLWWRVHRTHRERQHEASIDPGCNNDVAFGVVESCPFGIPGDRLWVRESWAETDGPDGTPCVVYRAGGSFAVARDEWTGPDYLAYSYTWDGPPYVERWRPSIHMPRWASRITLEVTDVRVQRLNDISEDDALADGCAANKFPGPWWQGYMKLDDGELLHQQAVGENPPAWMVEPKPMRSMSHLDRSAVDEFRARWHSINGIGSWSANPWVWAVTFRRVP